MNLSGRGLYLLAPYLDRESVLVADCELVTLHAEHGAGVPVILDTIPTLDLWLPYRHCHFLLPRNSRASFTAPYSAVGAVGSRFTWTFSAIRIRASMSERETLRAKRDARTDKPITQAMTMPTKKMTNNSPPC